ncbi:hypothetical protein LCGC14_0725770 [marine sediment metagenome]|uniref:Uncharacterized protein n=1 Tax=marine sediment metagenome TaxID=412755 RepID=A0A0F9SW97_9ZZZZ
MVMSIEVESKKFNEALTRFIRKSNIPVGVAIRKTAFDALKMFMHPPGGKQHPV